VIDGKKEEGRSRRKKASKKKGSIVDWKKRIVQPVMEEFKKCCLTDNILWS
jgi:hypothetical protein